MARRPMGGAKKEYKHHKNDRCFRCRERNEVHGHAKDKNGNICTEFEFIPYTARHRDDTLFCVQFKSSSGPEIWTTKYYRQGDASCNCMGFRFQRKCSEHVDLVLANVEHYRKQANDLSKLNGGADSVEVTVANLNRKMAEMEAAVKSGNPIEIAKLQAEIDYQRQMFSVAGSGLAERFNQVVANIEKHVWGNTPEPKIAQPAPVRTDESEPVIVGVDEDPFA